MSGLELLTQLVESTGLPPEAVYREVDRLLEKYGVNREQISMETLRLILADYLQDVLLEAKQDIA